MGDQPLWGIDLGGTKIECVVLKSAKNPAVLQRTRIDTQGDHGYQHVLSRIKLLIDQVSQETGLSAKTIGFGTPGSLDPDTRLLRGSNSRWLLNQPLAKDLEKLLGIPVIIENDANCFALAETCMGVVLGLGSDVKVVFGVIMGTGVGAGLVINQQLISGPNMIAGEWGHNFLDQSGGPCYCGQTGCVETIISGPALEKHYLSLAGVKQPLSEIVRLAETGDANAVATVTRLTHFFGVGISAVINIIDPDVIVLGGGVGNIEALYSSGFESAAQSIFSPTLKSKIVKPTLGDSAGVFGAAFLTTNKD